MPSTDRSPRAKKSISLSVMLGTLLLPLSAYAASTFVERSGAAEPGTATVPPSATEAAVAAAPSIADDLETACGEAGLGLIAAETTGSIGELQQAALDALRGVCAEQGLPLPAPPATHPAVTTVTQPTPPPPSGPMSGEVVLASDEDDHDDNHSRHGGEDDEEGHDRYGGDDDDDDQDRHGGDND